MDMPKFNLYTNAELETMLIRCKEEIESRRKKQAERLVADFKQAYENLMSAGITILKAECSNEFVLDWSELRFRYD